MTTQKYLTIDGIPVEIGGEKNVLELIRKVGIKLPTFCYHTELSIYGACRMCMVEIDGGGLDAACSTVPRAGMTIRTNTEQLRRYRKMILELLLANHCRDCTTCSNNGMCKLQVLAMRFGIDRVRFPNTASAPLLDESSPCIVRDHNKCILCGDCVRMCNEVQDVGAIDFAHRGYHMKISTPFDIPIAESVCVGCGQCSAICPTGAIVVHQHIGQVWKLLDDPTVKVVAQIAPAVRVGLGREMGLPAGSDSMGRIVACLKHMGFEEVYDTATGADLTVMEESEELLHRLAQGEQKWPLFTSCCPAWVQYVEHKFPELLPHVSTCKSPMEMFAAVVGEHHRRFGDGRRVAHIAIMPCTAKKYEAQRPEFSTNGQQDVEYVLTTQELVRMIRESGILFDQVIPQAVDMPFAFKSGAGVIFGTSGGVTEAVLRMLAKDKSSVALKLLSFQGVRGLEGLKETELPYGGRVLKIAMVSGLGNASALIRRIGAGEAHYDFVEVMACPNGCISGGGQPFVHPEDQVKRMEGLYQADQVSRIKRSGENPAIAELYKTLIGDRAHQLLHTVHI